MQITLVPIRSKDTRDVAKAGDVLTIAGKPLDFSALPDGATLPRAAIDSPWIAGPAHRIGGELHIALLDPFPPGRPRDEAILIDVPDGPVLHPDCLEVAE